MQSLITVHHQKQSEDKNNYIQNEKKTLRETQTLRAGCSKAQP